MTRIHLVRHGHHDLLGRVLCGRTTDIGLSPRGCSEMNSAAAQFAGRKIAAIQSSPRLRTRQSATILASMLGNGVDIVAALDEIDFGDWSDRPFSELDQDPRWMRWNTARANARAPQGESMAEAQTRMVVHLSHIAAAHPDGSVIVVSHAEPIRAALLFHRHLSLDRFMEIEVAPASVCTLTLGDRHARRGVSHAMVTV